MMFTERDYYWMQQAIKLAEQAATLQEVPVGALIVHSDNIIGSGHNSPIHHCDPSAHAEMIAIRQASHSVGNYRLMNTTLYVTLEPCIMCVGAIVQARIERVVFGAYDLKAGAVESVFQFGTTPHLNHKPIYQGGLLADQCGDLLSKFFQMRRVQQKLVYDEKS